MRSTLSVKLKLLLGTSKSAAFFTVANAVIYGTWLAVYTVCTGIRASLFSQAQSRMALAGQMDYIVTVSSPVFGVLKAFLYLLPVFALIWAVVIKKEEGRNVLCDRKLVAFALAAILGTAFAALLDIGKIGMLF